MGCEESPIIVPDAKLKADAGIPLEVILERRDVCRQCEHATRSADPRFAVNKGLTSKSVCRLVKKREPHKPANIKLGTTMASARCPLDLWGKFPT